MFVVLIAAVMMLGAATMLVAKDYPMGIAPKQEITFTAPTLVGGNLLPAGDYTVLHEMPGTTHIMIFQQVGGKAEARAKCNLVPLTAKAKNEPVLVEMTFKRRQRETRTGAVVISGAAGQGAPSWTPFFLHVRHRTGYQRIASCRARRN
jgi:hypothetical protein